MELENLGSLITYKDSTGQDRCLGYLFDFTGHGVYDPTIGKVDLSQSDMIAHNAALDSAMLQGLDDNCAVGMRGTFYLTKRDGRVTVTTWSGTLVSDNVTVNGKQITFRRNGHIFAGRAQKNADCFNFRRVS